MELPVARSQRVNCNITYRLLILVLLLISFPITRSFAESDASLGTTRVFQNHVVPMQLLLRQNETALPYKNEIGISQEEDWISDLKEYWSFSSLYYYRHTCRGIFGARFNYANKYFIGGEQYVLEAYPYLTKDIYLAATFGLSNTSQQVFPKYQYLIEPYFNLGNGFEASAGQRFIRSFNVNIYTYTASIGKTIGSYFIWFRPYHYTPQSVDFFEAGIKRFFGDSTDTYILLKAGIGKTPDIGDVPPLNQITIISTNSVTIDGQFPIAKGIFLNVGAGYARQVYPSGHVREDTNGSVNVIWRF